MTSHVETSKKRRFNSRRPSRFKVFCSPRRRTFNSPFCSPFFLRAVPHYFEDSLTSTMSSDASSLTGPSLQASRAALSAAMAEQSHQAPTDDELVEAGEIQEIDMQGQAETIRTVFNDASNFNVKVRIYHFSKNLSFAYRWLSCNSSILFILLGHSGSIHP